MSRCVAHSSILVLLLYVANLALALSDVATAAPLRRVGLVIGNSAYQHATELANPRNDAAEIARALKKLGVQVIEGYDLSRLDMERRIREFAEALENADIGVFYYAGHGLQVSGENYLVPIDAALSTASALDFEMVRLSLVQRAMERAADSNVIFLDACRDNPLARNLAREFGTRSLSIGRGLAQMEAGFGTLISFSTQPGNVATDGIGKNSPYAEALANELEKADEDLSTILINVRNAVMAATSNTQVPWEHSALRAKLYLFPPKKDAALIRDRTPPTLEISAQDPNDNDARTHETLARSYDGIWEIRGTAKSSKCKIQTFDYTIEVVGGSIYGGRRTQGGTVKADGSVVFKRTGKYHASATLEFTGRISGSAGDLKYRTLGGRCHGIARMQKLGLAASGN